MVFGGLKKLRSEAFTNVDLDRENLQNSVQDVKDYIFEGLRKVKKETAPPMNPLQWMSRPIGGLEGTPGPRTAIQY